jgi:hypothetical protein
MTLTWMRQAGTASLILRRERRSESRHIPTEGVDQGPCIWDQRVRRIQAAAGHDYCSLMLEQAYEVNSLILGRR